MAINLLASIATTDSGDGCPASWDTVGKNGSTPMTATVSIAGTGSVVLVIATACCSSGDTNDHVAEYRLTIGGTAQPPILDSFIDTTSGDEVNAVTLIWAETGRSGLTTFTLEWQYRIGSPTLSSHYRSLQIIEFTEGCTILEELTTSGSDESGGSWADVPGLVTTDTSCASGKTQLLITNFQPAGGSDESAGLRFGIDGVNSGPESATWVDGSDQTAGTTLLWFTAQAGTHDFSVRWITLNGTAMLDSSRPSTLQVLEFDSDIISLDKNALIATTNGECPSSWADMLDMADSAFSVDGTSSVVFLAACGIPASYTSDQSAALRFADNDTLMGGEFEFFNDETNGASGWCLAWAKTGISGSHDFALQWQESQTAALYPDGTRYRSFQIAEFSVGGAPSETFFENRHPIEQGMKPQTAAGMGGVLIENRIAA